MNTTLFFRTLGGLTISRVHLESMIQDSRSKPTRLLPSVERAASCFKPYVLSWLVHGGKDALTDLKTVILQSNNDFSASLWTQLKEYFDLSSENQDMEENPSDYGTIIGALVVLAVIAKTEFLTATELKNPFDAQSGFPADTLVERTQTFFRALAPVWKTLGELVRNKENPLPLRVLSLECLFCYLPVGIKDVRKELDHTFEHSDMEVFTMLEVVSSRLPDPLRKYLCHLTTP